MNSAMVLEEDRGAVRILTLNRPEKLNSITGELVRELLAALEAAMSSTDVAAIVITGAGSKAFCAGDDLDEDLSALPASALEEGVQRMQDITRSICFGHKPVIAAVNGWAIGGGFEWVVNCDFSVWSDDATGFMPELDWGLFVTGAVTVLLPRLVGLNRARELLYLGRRLSAKEAAAWGLASRVVAPDIVVEEAVSLAASLAAKPAPVRSALKRALVLLDHCAIDQALRFEARELIRAVRDPESRRRISTSRKRQGGQ